MLVQETLYSDWVMLLEQAIRQANTSHTPVLVSTSQELSAFAPLELLQRATALSVERAYWAQADNSLTLVGIGSAHAMDLVEPSRFRQAASGWRELLANAMYGDPRVLPGVGPLLLGGFAFDPNRASSALWKGFPAGRFVLPKLLFTKTRDSFWLTRNLVVHADSDLEMETFLQNALLSEIIEDDAPDHRPTPLLANAPSQIQSREPVTAADWESLVARAVRTIRRGELEKVVVARALELQAPQPFDEIGALEYFASNAPGTYQFAFGHAQACFLGATFEQPVRVRDGHLNTMGVAGSVPRGATPEQDQQFGDELLASAKDRSEQEIVVRDEAGPGERCAELTISDTPALLKLRSIQHLITRFQGTLANGYTVLDLVEGLHPTPAVGGLPRIEALQWLAEHENLDRGWYAGAVGWIDQNFEGEFAVAIRSALLRENRATIFAGCGIVADSDPAREYAESALKMKPMLAALNVS